MARVERQKRLKSLEAVANRFKAWRPAREVLTRVRAVPTDFVQADWATRCGGWPIERFCTVHGPSNHGKTLWTHGLGLSFLKRGHFYGFIDAEMTTPEDWLVKLLGKQADNPAFLAKRPETFEQAVDAMREFAMGIYNAREAGEIGPDVTGIAVVDSITKLVPKDLFAAVRRGAEAEARGQKARGVDGARGAAGMIKAKLIRAWLDELTPLLNKTGIGVVFITRERGDPDFDDDFNYTAELLEGGRAMMSDASLVVRITRAKWLAEGEGEMRRVLGERHRARIWKTKVGGKDDKYVDAFFHTSNGTDAPEGFDPARDLIELGKDFGVITVSGSWLRYGERKWQGEPGALRALRESEELRLDLERALRARFEENDPEELGEKVDEPEVTS